PGYDISSPIGFSQDGERLFLRTVPRVPSKGQSTVVPPKMEVWSTMEQVIPPMTVPPASHVFQKAVSSPAVVWLPQRRFVQLGDTTTLTMVSNDNRRYALLEDVE